MRSVYSDRGYSPQAVELEVTTGQKGTQASDVTLR
jgi:cold shock CspA family protein